MVLSKLACASGLYALEQGRYKAAALKFTEASLLPAVLPCCLERCWAACTASAEVTAVYLYAWLPLPAGQLAGTRRLSPSHLGLAVAPPCRSLTS